jgi:hypothetical protein
MVESEEKVEEHNKRVVTRYKPGETPDEEERVDSDEDQQSLAQVNKVSREGTNKVRFSPQATKTSKDTGRKARDAQEDEPDTTQDEEGPGERGLASANERLIAVIENMSKRLGQSTPTTTASEKPKCWDYERRGACKRGSDCRFAHEGGGQSGGPPPYPLSPPKRRRDDTARPESPRDKSCWDYERGSCKRGRDCKFTHGTIHNSRDSGKTQTKSKCARAVDKGTCDIYACDLYHGRWNRDSTSLCHSARDGRHCPHLWMEGGCKYTHDKKAASSHSRESPKNGGGLSRPEKKRR